jgi:hypothetical protein
MTLFGPRITIFTKDGKSYTKQATGREFIWDFNEEVRRIREVHSRFANTSRTVRTNDRGLPQPRYARPRRQAHSANAEVKMNVNYRKSSKSSAATSSSDLINRPGGMGEVYRSRYETETRRGYQGASRRVLARSRAHHPFPSRNRSASLTVASKVKNETCVWESLSAKAAHMEDREDFKSLWIVSANPFYFYQ